MSDDINALIRRAARSAGRKHQVSSTSQPAVLKEQAYRKEGVAREGEPAAPIVAGEWEGEGCWMLQGQPIREGMILEVYTNRANGFIRGQVHDCWPERPRLLLTVWNPWGQRDVDGLPPKVGAWEVELYEGIMCKFTGALPLEID